MKQIFQVLLLLMTCFSGFGQSLKLFYLNSFEIDSVQKVGFITLSDENNWSGGQTVISAEYYKGEARYHELTPSNRALFLSSIGVSKSDRIFVYNMSLDSVFTYNVEKTPLKARQGIYSDFDYYVGFEIKDIELEIMGEYYWNTFVSIGKTCPFQTGHVSPMR